MSEIISLLFVAILSVIAVGAHIYRSWVVMDFQEFFLSLFFLLPSGVLGLWVIFKIVQSFFLRKMVKKGRKTPLCQYSSSWSKI